MTLAAKRRKYTEIAATKVFGNLPFLDYSSSSTRCCSRASLVAKLAKNSKLVVYVVVVDNTAKAFCAVNTNTTTIN